MRYRLFANVLLSCVLLPALALSQDISTPQDIGDPQYIYRLVYDQALADSILTPDESALLQTLRLGLGFEEPLVESIIGATAPPQPPGIDQSGRWTMMGQNMLWAAGLYGWGIPYVFGIEDPKIYVASWMFSLGQSLYLTWGYTSRTPFPEARSQMQRMGELVGLHTGLTLNSLLEHEGKPAVLTVMVGVPIGAWIGDKLYHQWRPSTGQAYALAPQSELGRSFTSLVHYIIDPLPVEPDYDDYLNNWAYDQQKEDWDRIHNVYQLAGYPLGVWLGHKFYGSRQYSFGDALMLTMGRGVGALYGLLLSQAISLDMEPHETLWRVLVTASSAGTMLATDKFISGYDYRFGQTAMMALGGIAGAAAGVGICVLLETEFETTAPIIIASSLLGFKATHNILDLTPEYHTADATTDSHVLMSIAPALSGGELVPMGNLSFTW
ncbi:hypothetical protein ACFL6E_03185 [Candidatus Neomarinimicrobiota bacterium]